MRAIPPKSTLLQGKNVFFNLKLFRSTQVRIEYRDIHKKIFSRLVPIISKLL